MHVCGYRCTQVFVYVCWCVKTVRSRDASTSLSHKSTSKTTNRINSQVKTHSLKMFENNGRIFFSDYSFFFSFGLASFYMLLSLVLFVKHYMQFNRVFRFCVIAHNLPPRERGVFSSFSSLSSPRRHRKSHYHHPRPPLWVKYRIIMMIIIMLSTCITLTII